MKLRKSKGFTIIELVIVIAVIGILTAVLVPTFINLTAKANEAADDSLVKNLNTALKMEEQTPGHEKAPTLQGAIDDLKVQGFLLENIVAKSGKDLLWDQSKNQFVLDKEGNYSGLNYWQIVSRIPDTQKFSYYAGKNFSSDTVTVKYGFDTGDNKISTVNYTREDSDPTQIVSIRTNSTYTTLTVSAKNDTVNHYGNANVVNVTKVSPSSSYHEKGSVATLKVKEGKVVIEADAFIGKMGIDTEATSASVIVDNKGTLFNADEINYNIATYDIVETPTNPVVTEAKETVVSEDDELSIGTADALINLANAQSQGIVGSDLEIVLANDINLTGKSWVPFGADLGTFVLANKNKPYSNAFGGKIDGNNHKIIGLSNGAYQGVKSANTSTPNFGENYAFISNVKGDVEIKNLTFEDVDISAPEAKICAAVIATTLSYDTTESHNAVNASSVTLRNVNVSGKISAADKCAGLIGYTTVGTGNVNVNFYDCDVDANIEICSTSSDGYRLGGFVSQMGDRTVAHIYAGCSFKGSVLTKNDYGTQNASGAFICGFVSSNLANALYVADFEVDDGAQVQTPVKAKGSIIYSSGTTSKCLIWAQNTNNPCIDETIPSKNWKVTNQGQLSSWDLQ